MEQKVKPAAEPAAIPAAGAPGATKDGLVMDVLQQMLDQLKSLSQGQQDLTAVVQAQGKQIVENEVRLQEVAARNAARSPEEQAAAESAAVAIPVEVEERFRQKKLMRLNAPKVQVLWHGPAVTMDGVTVGPFPEDEMVEVPHWVVSLWKDNAKTMADGRRFANNLARTAFLGEYS